MWASPTAALTRSLIHLWDEGPRGRERNPSEWPWRQRGRRASFWVAQACFSDGRERGRQITFSELEAWIRLGSAEDDLEL